MHSSIPSVGPAAGGGPLSDAHLAQLAAATLATRRIRRAAGVAKASAWTSGALGALTLLGVIFGDLTSLVLGGVLITLAVREARLGARLTTFDAAAPRHLAINQLILGVVIVLYAVWQASRAWLSNGLSSGNEPIGDPQVDAMLADVGSMVRMVTVGVYACVGVGGALGTGLMALFYYRRERMMREFLSQTTPWVTQALRAAA